MNKEKYYYKKEISMSVTVIVLITIFIKILINNKFINGFSDEIGDNQVVAALTQDDKIGQPEYFEFKFISKEQFLKYQIGNIKEQIIYCSTMNNFYNDENQTNGMLSIIVDRVTFLDKSDENYKYIGAHITLKNKCEKSGLFKIKPICQIMLDEGIYNDKLNDKFKLIDMKFDTDIEGYTLPEIDNSSNNLNSDMGYVRTDDWKSFAFRVYIESNSEISYTCVFRTPKEYADDENLVIGNDDSHASRRWDGEKEVTYDNGGYRIYINRQ